MKRFCIYALSLIILLCVSACSSKQTPNNTPISTTPPIEEDVSFDVATKILEKENYLKNKEEETTTYVMYLYDGSSFNTNILPVPKQDKYNSLANQLSTLIGMETLIPNSIEKIEDKIIIDLNKSHISYFNSNLKQEIIFLESYAKTFSENLGGLVYFTVEKQNYESEHMYFGIDEYYPITTGLF